MRLLRDYILNEIKTRLPEFKTVRMFNNQFAKSNSDNLEDNTEDAFDYPACFVEFDVVEVRTVALGVKYLDLIIRLHIGLEEYSKERPQDYTFIDLVDTKMQGMRASSTDTVQFSSLIEVITDIDEDFNNVNNPILEYQTTYTRKNAFTRAGFTTKTPPTDLDVIGTKI